MNNTSLSRSDWTSSDPIFGHVNRMRTNHLDNCIALSFLREPAVDFCVERLISRRALWHQCIPSGWDVLMSPQVVEIPFNSPRRHC